jgi:glycosyltransferase involved in cell wall biosynthesis
MDERRMTVLQILPALQAGGVERGTIEVAAELVRQGHRAIVVSGGGAMVQELQRVGAEHIRLPVGRKSLLSLRHVGRLRRLFRREGVDIVHARSRLPAWLAYLAWRGMNKQTRPRFVTTVHGFYSVKRYSAIMTRGEKVIAVSDSIRRYIVDNYPKAEPGNIVVIPRGVDPKFFPPGYRPPSGWQSAWYAQFPSLLEKRIITLPGRLTRLKGHHAFIDLVARLQQEFPDIHGLIVGGEDPKRMAYARELRQKVNSLGLDETITFTGQRSDIREVYGVSNLVLSLSSQPESFGRTVLEALALGIPVAGYDHGGVGEILAALFPQGRVKPGDADALYDTVKQLLSSGPHEVAGNPFTLQAMLDATLAVYHSLAEE